MKLRFWRTAEICTCILKYRDYNNMGAFIFPTKYIFNTFYTNINEAVPGLMSSFVFSMQLNIILLS